MGERESRKNGGPTAETAGRRREQQSLGAVATALETERNVSDGRYESAERRESVDIVHGERCGGRSIGRYSRARAKSV